VAALLFRDYVCCHKAKLEALAILLDRPYGKRVTTAQLEALAVAATNENVFWTLEKLWRMFAGNAHSPSQLTDWIPIIRYAAGSKIPLETYRDGVQRRLIEWLERNLARDISFNAEQRHWFEVAADHFAVHLRLEIGDLDGETFTRHGGRKGANELFGNELAPLLKELSEALY